jgi:hypothetical protein
MTTCAILPDSYFECQRMVQRVKTPGRVIAFAINNYPRWYPLRSATTNRDLAGRGARPRWFVAAMKGGKKLETFLIDKSTRKRRKNRKSKR